MRAHIVSGLLLLLALAPPVHAEDESGRSTPSLERVLPEIRRHTPGTFYDAEGPFAGPGGQQVYRIKWMTPDGRIIWFDADARTGRILTPMQGGQPGGNRPGGNRFDGGSDRFGNWPSPGYDRDDHRGRDRDGGTWRRDEGGNRGDRDGRGGHN
ncbi:MAG: hypothetical protein KGL29_03170 [Alphaproteobacteria bacterium]|nr:hypothetical protein [Alphaproteobacteria bacterium]MDE2264877.1 hypothetical protein [Alphaproteobacteria bacterium]